MKPDGKAENVLEQLLWAYAMGRVFDPNTRALTLDPAHPLQLTLVEITAMYNATCGVTPRRDDIQKWLGTVNKFLRALARTA